MSLLIPSGKFKARYFQSKKHFVNDICAIDDNRDVGRFFCDILKELKLKVEHQIDDDRRLLLYKKSVDKRDLLPFLVVWIPHMKSNIPHNIFHFAVKDEPLGISHSTLWPKGFIPKAKKFLQHKKNVLNIMSQVAIYKKQY